MRDLEMLREQINDIDEKMLDLFLERMKVSEEVAKYKIEKNLPLFHPRREEEILKWAEENSGEEANYSQEFFEKIMELSKKKQREKMGGYGLLGEHLGHSFSKDIHQKMNCEKYDLIEIEPGELEKFLRDTDYRGLNVTIPYKKTVMKCCRNLSEDAMACGSVNTLVRQKDGWYGYNTDVDGFCYMMKKSGIQVEGKKVLILGNGGAAGAVKQGLKRLLAREIVVISRRGEDNYDNLSRHFDAQIIVNTTPVGMYPDLEEKVIQLKDFTQCEGLVDIIYNPLRTQLIQEAEELNIKYTNGLSMLVAQAWEAEKLFFEKDMQEDVVDKVLAEVDWENRNLVLVGMPGCGKTTLGKRFGEALQRPFIDLDEEIERYMKMSIPQIFEEKGEDFFREVETKVLREVIKQTGIVLATGGGTILRDENKKLLRSNGYVIHVERELDKLEKKGRPLSQKQDVRKLYEERKKHYEIIRDAIFLNVEHF